MAAMPAFEFHWQADRHRATSAAGGPAMNIARGSARALFVSALAASLLNACGGGSGYSSSPPPPPPPPPSADVTPPTATLTAPANLATGLVGTVALTATGADDVGVASMEFQVDGVTIAMATSS